jgi:methyl-accepting chemotaxis protein
MNRIGTQLRVLSISGIISMLALTGIQSYYQKVIVASFSTVTDVNLNMVVVVGKIRNLQRDIVMTLNSVVSSKEAVKDIDKMLQEYHNKVNEIDSLTKNYEKFPPQTTEEIDRRKAVADAWQTFVLVADKFFGLAGSSKVGDLAEIQKMATGELAAARKAYRNSFEEFVQYHENQANKVSNEAKHVAEKAFFYVIIAVVVGIILQLGINWRISSYVNGSLSSIVGKIVSIMKEAIAVSNNITAYAQELASSSDQQNSSLQKTASSMEQVSGTVNKTSENAQNTRAVTESTNDEVLRTQNVVLKVVEAIESISESNTQIGNQIDLSNQEIKEIVRVMAEIQNRTKVINDIVFQTKLLSFNASVEAARAGEHGKGFAVVAEEVGKLAAMSGKAAEGISANLEESVRKVEGIIQKSSTQISGLLERNRGQIEHGVQTANESKTILQTLVTNVSSVHHMAKEIALAAEEQSRGIHEINSSVAQLTTVAAQTSQTSTNLATISNQLEQQNSALEAVVRQLSDLVSEHKDSFEEKAS